MNSNYLKNILSNRNISIYRLSKISGIGDGRWAIEQETCVYNV